MFGGEKCQADLAGRKGDIRVGNSGGKVDSGWRKWIVMWDGDAEMPEAAWETFIVVSMRQNAQMGRNQCTSADEDGDRAYLRREIHSRPLGPPPSGASPPHQQDRGGGELHWATWHSL